MATGGHWSATVYAQNVRGQDHFSTPSLLSFYLNITTENTLQKGLPTVQLMNKDSSLSDKIDLYTYVGKATCNRWQKINIPLSNFKNLLQKRSEDIIGIVFTQNSNDGQSHRFYIDDIALLPQYAPVDVTHLPKISGAKGYARHVDIEWQKVNDDAIKWVKIYRSENGKNFIPVGIQGPMINRYADYTGQEGKSYQYKISAVNKNDVETALSDPINATTKKMNDEELLSMVQEACFRYYWEGAEEKSGLALENIPGRKNMVATGASGFGIMAIITGVERGFINRKEAVERFTRIVNFLKSADKFHGAFSHFMDGPTGNVEPFFGPRDNGGDLVETSFLMQGLLTARAYFSKETSEETYLREVITEIWQGIEWDWYRQFEDSKFLYWHWSPDKGWIINHRLIGWNETMITYILAMASPTHAIPASMYYTGWASEDSFAQQYRANWGQTNDGTLYKNGNTYFGIPLPVGVSNGGPLFFTHYSYLGLDPHKVTDAYTNYFINNKNIALINYRYCVENNKGFTGYSDSCWGLTASDGPYHYAANEPVPWQDEGKIAPTGAIASFPYTPAESMKALKNYYYNYGSFLWGEYGFRDAFDLSKNWCSDIYMGLNAAPITVMIENYRTGLLWKLFMSNGEVTKALNNIKQKP